MKISKIVKTKKSYVFIDTCKLDNKLGNMIDMMGLGNPDAVAGEYETMVFSCDKNGNVKNWGELEKDNYKTEKEAIKGHNKIINKWKLK